MNIEQIISLIEAVSTSGLGEFEYKKDGVKLVLKAKAPICVSAAPTEGQMSLISAPEAMDKALVGTDNHEVANKSEVIKSPIVGTFYSAPSEGEKPFVAVGDVVKKGQIIGIIETMKLMNELESDKEGVVTAILIENEQVVEFGQPLMEIN